MTETKISRGPNTGRPGMPSETYDRLVREQCAALDEWHKQTGIEVIAAFGRPGNEGGEAHLAYTVDPSDVARVLTQMLEQVYRQITGDEVAVRIEFK